MNQRFKPESLMMSYGYKPEWSEGAIKCPIFQTSTFVFRSAEEGKAHFELAYGLREPEKGEQPGLIYSRLNNPDLEILENRLCLWDEAEEAAVFESGMSAISTALFAFLKPGDILLYSNPLYGGTAHFISDVLVGFGVKVVPFHPGEQKAEILDRINKEGGGDRLSMIYVETPANPTNAQIDIAAMSEIAALYSTEDKKVVLAVDNTYMGPLWQHPLKHGADLVLYSATKYIGGHSDVIAGACLGSKELMGTVKTLRTFLGSMAGPWTGWLLMRSLETLKVRMEQQVKNAQKVARFLNEHPSVEKVYYLGLLQPSDGEQYEIYQRQCSAPGAMVSFDVKGGEKEAFAFMNKLKIIKLAVSLGSTESLVQHPATMTHAGVPEEVKQQMNVTHKLVRLSVGVEHVDDLIWDLGQALDGE
ncbi:MAG: cystathionine gamma-synthase family protein [Chitinophagales bacterium]|nr:cystathionine gamma-synthase family protein [Chitinophagales bacterium]